ncbi:MAG: hypothetical protein ACFCUM_12560 [Bacteroidales bacterium]|jgi:hypothetical protein
MDDENIYDRIQDIFGHFPEHFSILEEKIDIDLQMEYFEFSRGFKKNLISDNILSVKDNLFEKENSIANKKKLLVQLASIEEVEAYRAIEKYVKEPDSELREWAILAFQESRMLIQSKLLDENQVFISTGLGGKGAKLRYFVVLLNSFGSPFDELQQKLIRTEIDFFLKKQDAELEEVNFMNDFCSLLAIVPIKVSIRDVFKAAIAECNEYGGFIRNNFIVTNVKTLSYEEIKDFVEKQKDIGNLEEE